MPKISDAYAGQFVTAQELIGKGRVPAVITQAVIEEVGQEKREKLVLSLASNGGKPWPRRLVCNQTRSGTLIMAYGDDTDLLVGKPIEVWAAPVNYQGRMVQGIHVSPPGMGGNGSMPAVSPPSYPPPPPAPAAAPDLDDEIPF